MGQDERAMGYPTARVVSNIPRATLIDFGESQRLQRRSIRGFCVSADIKVNGYILGSHSLAVVVNSKVQGCALGHHTNLVAHLTNYSSFSVLPRGKLLKRWDLCPTDQTKTLH